MCTLTFIPFSNGAVLTHNRDEHELRKHAVLPEIVHKNGKKFIFPKDGQAGGTWIGLSETKSLCLLNGAFEAHQSNPPYQKSRGLVLLDALELDNLEIFCEKYSLEYIEPFTMIEFNHQTNELFEFRWTGNSRHLALPDLKPQIWSSATLYTPEQQKIREQLFHQFIEKTVDMDESKIKAFHTNTSTGDVETSLVMKRPNGVKTLSISQISTVENLQFYHEDRIFSTITNLILPQ